ncbi:hypothetical protein BN2497_2585 [Janthinobacterium sp. CG23_2]|nr:hypothetical protein BN2497_2585 [Janthinobacterium sp. CG23_2]CUU27690.1 hypothetical protein BN3177_2585 [Janthinobacterium sp. CG23_2]
MVGGRTFPTITDDVAHPVSTSAAATAKIFFISTLNIGKMACRCA